MRGLAGIKNWGANTNNTVLTLYGWEGYFLKNNNQ